MFSKATGVVFASLVLLFLGGCVSINVGSSKAERSKNVSFQAPDAPFAVLKETHADQAWLNHRNGNSISYFSTCRDPADPSLENITQDLFSDLKDMKTIASDHISFSGREALKSEVEGTVDGVLTRIEALVFKKNDCSYTLSYVGLKSAFEADRAKFETFMKSFQAP
jgi:hypothetical protein